MKRRGFSLVELLVAVAVFAALAATAWGALSRLALTRAAVEEAQQRLADVARSVSTLERELRHLVARPVRDGSGALLPALAGRGDALEFTTIGVAQPGLENGSRLQRVAWQGHDGALWRQHWEVLDRVPGSTPQRVRRLDDAGVLRVRYLGCDGQWRQDWPPPRALACAGPAAEEASSLPRAVELRLAPDGLGELRRLVELPAAWPAAAAQGEAPP